MSELAALAARGQAIWLDYIRRDLLVSGRLSELVGEGLRGMTSNPTIFEKAIGGSDEYDDAVRAALAEESDIDTTGLFERLAVADIRHAADVLREVYDATEGGDGFVSLEVSPHLARDTAGTAAEARRLWDVVDRPNLMIKVPGTAEGIPAVEELLAAGLNINVTLMFSLAHYEAVAHAYLRGVARAAVPAGVASVASFFVSRIDTAVDAALEQVGNPEALAHCGKAAVVNAKAAYRRYRQIFEGDEFAALRDAGARPQRVLWASTSTKNPAYSDVMYVEELIGPGTVNTLPPATLDAFRDHGVVRGDTITEGWEDVDAHFAALAELGIDMDEVTEQLQVDGVKAFADSYDQLLATLDVKRRSLLAEAVSPRP